MTTEKTDLKLLEFAIKNMVEKKVCEEVDRALQKLNLNPPKEEPALMTNEELSKKLKVSSSTLGRYRKKGMPFMKKGKPIYYNYSLVIKWIGGLRNDR